VRAAAAILLLSGGCATVDAPAPPWLSDGKSAPCLATQCSGAGRHQRCDYTRRGRVQPSLPDAVAADPQARALAVRSDWLQAVGISLGAYSLLGVAFAGGPMIAIGEHTHNRGLFGGGVAVTIAALGVSLSGWVMTAVGVHDRDAAGARFNKWVKVHGCPD
jgi:hypothetical protein